MRRTLRVLAGLSVAAAALMVYDLVRAATVGRRAQTIALGDSKERVRQVLGNPTTVFGPDTQGGWFSHPMETWVYGSWLETDEPFGSEFPWFLPLRFRLFGGHRDDVEIVFDARDRVFHVLIPDAE